MAIGKPSTNYYLPDSIRAKLDSVRRLLRRYLWRRWLLMVLCWLLLVFWIGAAIDYLPVRVGSSESPRWVRMAFLVAMAGGAVWMLVGWLMPRLFTRVRDTSIALLIERKYPQLNSELVTAVALTTPQASQPETIEGTSKLAYDEMVSRVLSRAEHSIEHVVPADLFNWRPIQWLRAAAIVGAVASLAVALLQWDWFNLWNRRLFGLSDHPWPRQAVLRVDWLQTPLPAFTGQLAPEKARIEFKNSTAYVPSGASLLLQVSADAAARRVPEICTLYYRSDDGTRGRTNLRRIGAPVEGWQQFNLDGPPLDGLASDLSLDIIGLDARLRNLSLEVVDRIMVVDMKLGCQYSKYLLDSFSTRPPSEQLDYRSGLKIPEGTNCTLLGRSNTALSRAEYTRRATAGEAEAPDSQLEILEAPFDGPTFQIPLGPLRTSELVEIRLTDEHGLPSEQILRYHVTVLPDTIPEVQSRLEGIGLAITPRAYLPVRGTAVDDYAVAKVMAEMSIDEHPLDPIPLQLDDTELTGQIDFEKLAEQRVAALRPGMTVGMSVVATDHFDLDAQPHAGRGQPLQLAVVNQDQLLVLLDRQELELRQRLEQIISELEQLYQAMQGLVEQFDQIESTAGTRNDFRSSAISFRSPDANVGANRNSDDEGTEQQAVERMALLRAQQSQLQTDKSRQELAGVANRVTHLRLQLAHNRIDSLDRQQRLLERVESPLKKTLDGDYVQLESSVAQLVSQAMKGKGKQHASEACDWLRKILVELEAIQANMLDIESFNELVDLVRGLLDRQEQILKETEDTQKARVLELFK